MKIQNISCGLRAHFENTENLYLRRLKTIFIKKLTLIRGIAEIEICSLGRKCQILKFSEIQDVGVA